jgi:hypothetical protein
MRTPKYFYLWKRKVGYQRSFHLHPRSAKSGVGATEKADAPVVEAGTIEDAERATLVVEAVTPACLQTSVIHETFVTVSAVCRASSAHLSLANSNPEVPPARRGAIADTVVTTAALAMISEVKTGGARNRDRLQNLLSWRLLEELRSSKIF